MAQGASWAQLSLTRAYDALPQMPSLSLQQQQLAQLSDLCRWRVLSADDQWVRDRQPTRYGMGMLAVVIAHVAVLWWLLAQPEVPEVKSAEPLMVSLITLPAEKQAPAPEVVPVIERKPIKQPVVQPKPIPQQPVERPQPVVEKIVEPLADQPRFEASAAESAPPMETPVAAATPTVAPAPVAPPKQAVEEKEEPPKFGVAYLNNPAPDYPRMSKRAGEQGKVLLKVLVSVEGRPSSVEVSKSSGFERLDSAALEAVKQWRFEPARKGSKAISAYVMVPLSFTLN